jgi:ABC-2 type transport system permease protein
MRNVLAIARKELHTYFASPIAYIVLAMGAIIFGFFFYSALAFFVQRGMESEMTGRGGPMSVNEFVIRPLLMNLSVISLFLVPMITMRLYAEEKRSGTIELLLTSPIRDMEMILGKLLAAFVLFACIMGIALINLAVLFIYGDPDWKPMAAGILGVSLMGLSFLSLGMMISTFTRNQIVAGALTFGLFLMLWVIDWVSAYSTAWPGQVANYLSLTTHLENFAKGVIDLKDVVYYLSVIFIGVFLTKRSLESLRWRS